MQEGLSRWKPALILVGATVVIVAVLVAFSGGNHDEKVPIESSASAPASAVAPAPPSTVATVTPTPLAPTAPSVGATPTAPSPPSSASEASTSIAPPVPSGSGVTPEWQVTKTEQALVAVQSRYDATKKEIDDLEKQGKTSEAAEKKILLGRLAKQISDMKVEIAGYKTQAAGDAGPSN